MSIRTQQHPGDRPVRPRNQAPMLSESIVQAHAYATGTGTTENGAVESLQRHLQDSKWKGWTPDGDISVREKRGRHNGNEWRVLQYEATLGLSKPVDLPTPGGA